MKTCISILVVIASSIGIGHSRVWMLFSFVIIHRFVTAAIIVTTISTVAVTTVVISAAVLLNFNEALLYVK